MRLKSLGEILTESLKRLSNWRAPLPPRAATSLIVMEPPARSMSPIAYGNELVANLNSFSK
jgi:hypothetical protein